MPHLPHLPGVYLMRDHAGAIIYVGKAKDLKKRVASYFTPSKANGAPEGRKVQALAPLIRHVDYVATASEREALVLERKLIHRYQPAFNSMWKDDKSYPYVTLTLNEDFPRLYLTRTKRRNGSLYFGPYPNVHSVKKLLHWAWRKKLFPLRPCRFEFDEKHLPPFKKVRSCLYLHTGECPAPCVGKISAKRYRKIADRAQWFFEGRSDKLVLEWEKEMKQSAKKENFEKAAELRDHIQTIRHMQEPVTFRQMAESELQGRIRASRAVQDLMKALDLPKPPERIECFDISHVQGVEKVASLVSFVRGKPYKDGYRKFIIKTVDGIDDFKSMAEVVGRRYERLSNEGKPFPDLILVDGGKGQLSAALKALADKGIKKIPMAALAKEEEEIFLPGRFDSLRLPNDSPALLLLRHVRDEAHRFAVTFHRLRRGKRTFDGQERKGDTP